MSTCFCNTFFFFFFFSFLYRPRLVPECQSVTYGLNTHTHGYAHIKILTNTPTPSHTRTRTHRHLHTHSRQYIHVCTVETPVSNEITHAAVYQRSSETEMQDLEMTPRRVEAVWTMLTSRSSPCDAVIATGNLHIECGPVVV